MVAVIDGCIYNSTWGSHGGTIYLLVKVVAIGKYIKIHDDFIRAKEVFASNEGNIEGLDSILRNMDSLLEKNQVIPIDALGEIFDPNLHEAIAITNDPELDDNTITKEIRKGYISHNKIIRPTLVEISKKQGKN